MAVGIQNLHLVAYIFDHSTIHTEKAKWMFLLGAMARVTTPQYPGWTRNRKKEKDLEDIQGLISVDRSSKATQPLTIPRPIQVVYKGSSPRNRQVW